MDNKVKLLHACLLKIALEIKKLCEENDINYFLMGGTMLGAIRHDGFIPWDDDIDIGMPRKDYEKFLLICEKELSDEYCLCTPYLEKDYGVPFAKLRLKETHFIDKGVPRSIDNGIYVDIFPIDKWIDDPKKRDQQNFHVHLWRNVLAAKCGYSKGERKALIRKIILFPLVLLPKSFIISREEAWQKKYNNEKTQYYINFTSAYKYGKEIYRTEWIETLVDKEFERETFKVPSDAHGALTQLYGDYMKLPPVEQRVFKHSEGEIDFGKYTYVYVD